MQHVIDEINSKFTFSISDDKISVHNKKEVELTIDLTLPEFQKNRILAAMLQKGCSVATSAI